MATEILKKTGTQIIFADHAADFSGGTAKTSLEVAGTDVQMDIASVAAAAGWESAKFDFGATRAAAYSCMAAIETGAAPTAGQTYDLYLAPSPISTAANGNPGQIDGTSQAAPSGTTSTGELILQCVFIGSLVVAGDANSVQVGVVGTFAPPERYGILIFINSTDQTTETNANEHHVVFNPIVDESQ